MLRAFNSQDKPSPIAHQSAGSAKVVNPPNIYHITHYSNTFTSWHFYCPIHWTAQALLNSGAARLSLWDCAAFRSCWHTDSVLGCCTISTWQERSTHAELYCNRGMPTVHRPDLSQHIHIDSHPIYFLIFLINLYSVVINQHIQSYNSFA